MLIHTRIALALAACMMLASVAFAQEESDPFDMLKNIPLTAEGDVYVDFGGQLRLRHEGWNNFGLAQGGHRDDNFLLTRIRAHADVHVGDNLRFFIEGKSAFSTDNDAPVGNRTLEVDELALQNAYAEFTLSLDDIDTDIVVRPGRQELLFGRQRLVSPLDWANARRTFDGVSIDLKHDNFKLTGFWTRAVVVDKYDFNDTSAAVDFYGLYATTPAICPLTGIAFNVDAYWLGLDRENVAFNTTAGDEQRHTFGARLYGKVKETGFDFDVEAAWQTGDIGNADINAWMFAAEIGYRFENQPMNPRVHLAFDYASGDDAPGGDVETFHQLFPLGHAYLGWADLVGRQNVIALNPGVTFTPIPKLTAKVNGHLFWRASDSDAAYNAGGGVLRAAAAGADSRELGAEIDFLATYKIDRHASISLGYSHFWAGQFIDQTGAASDVDFAYATFEYTF